MRVFVDEQGRSWTASVGRESYGMLVVLLVPDGGSEVRKAMLAAETRLDAQQELQALSEGDLRDRLQVSVPWEQPDISR
ncbi:hypothetical protein M0534_04015 [Methylonatrum kenyense]|uniref:hypothetical protein n=1 Tax=Methylonatrum kenyense TaxID=455253 RepID=UPI0020BDA184|nr:hypothetical protein [Methylonatrum kenyense]MCK8515500.1 hypothetical protein [Methylonatrum kenyense]